MDIANKRLVSLNSEKVWLRCSRPGAARIPSGLSDFSIRPVDQAEQTFGTQGLRCFGSILPIPMRESTCLAVYSGQSVSAVLDFNKSA